MTQPNVAPLTILQAEQRLAAAWGHHVTIRRDTHGYYAQDGDGTVMAFYHDGMLLDGVWETVLVPIIGDWPDCPQQTCGFCGGIGEVDSGGYTPWNTPINDICPECRGTGKIDCPPMCACGPDDGGCRLTAAQNERLDAAQRWNEQRGA